MATITGKTKAWITPREMIGPADLQSDETVQKLSYYFRDMTSQGWTCVGEAEITVTVMDTQTIVSNKVAALREQRKTVAAEMQMQITQIDSQINDLLAISYSPTVTSSPIIDDNATEVTF